MRLACVQMDVRIGDFDFNTQRVVGYLRSLSAQSVELAVFPEAALTGYCVSTPEDARSISMEADSAYLDQIQAAVDETHVAAAVGYACIENEVVTNRSTLFLPGAPRHTYLKTHLPYLGLDRFVTPGSEIAPFDTPFGKLGMLICFDLRLPEPTRLMALQGAQLLLLPTNWPMGAQNSANLIAPVRAQENRIFLATCNRVGTENGFQFFGHSKIIDPAGQILAAAGSDEEVLVADIDLDRAISKHVVTRPGEHEVELFASRRPDLYGPLVVSNSRQK